MKKLFLLLGGICLFSCESPKMSQARKELQANPNWESAYPDLKYSNQIQTKPVRNIAFVLSDFPFCAFLYMPTPLLFGTELRIQFDQGETQPITAKNEDSHFIDISGMIYDLVSAQRATISGDLFNIGLQESVTIPLAHTREAIQAMLILSKSPKSVDEFIAAGRMESHPEGLRENEWIWRMEDARSEQAPLTARFRSTAQLMRDFYLFSHISAATPFGDHTDSPQIAVYISETSQGLMIGPALEFVNADEAGSMILNHNTFVLPFRARFDDVIVQANLIQIDEKGQFFSLASLWKYLPNAREITARWPDENDEPVTRHAYINGLEYRLIQAYAAWYLTHPNASSLT